ncbi:chaplin [Streptomyces sp. NPDC049916]|uniref:chaplin n=1 Tax=unclassified Streptomyces TaxID=2593676 RepID=UPI00343B717E
MSRMTKVAAVMAGTGALIAGGAGMASADAGAQSLAAGSPGVGSGNSVQVPVHVPVNVCGNTINVIGLLNPAFGNTCVNASEGHDDKGDYGYGR